jgi:oligoribonuclease
MHVPDENNLIWIDLEMTGLDPDRDSIIEIATIVTDKDLVVLAEGPEFAIRHPLERLEAMDDWNRNQHRKSGLWQRVLDSSVDIATAEALTMDFLVQWLPAGKSPMCGNSICQDRRFLYRLMPRLERFFHYRNLDVSTIKELARRWAPDVARVSARTPRTPRSATCMTRSPSCAITGRSWGGLGAVEPCDRSQRFNENPATRTRFPAAAPCSRAIVSR